MDWILPVLGLYFLKIIDHLTGTTTISCSHETLTSRGGGLALMDGIRRMIFEAKGAGYILKLLRAEQCQTNVVGDA